MKALVYKSHHFSIIVYLVKLQQIPIFPLPKIQTLIRTKGSVYSHLPCYYYSIPKKKTGQVAACSELHQITLNYSWTGELSTLGVNTTRVRNESHDIQGFS